MKRILAVALALAMLVLSVPFSAAAAPALTAQTVNFSQMEGYYKTQGRVALSGTTLLMDTSSSGFEFYFYGAGDFTLSAAFRAGYTTNMFFSVIVDGVETRTEVNNASTGTFYDKTITLASGLEQGYHHIEFYKQTEASSAFVTAKSISLTGTLMPAPADDKIVMEVVGDSISGGASNLATNSTANASYPVYQDGTATYAYVAGEALGANVRVTQTSGYGCVSGWNSNGVNLQMMWPYTNYHRDHTTTGEYDFNPPADIVVINLGTNDSTAANKNGLTNAQFKAGAINLMTMARNDNPNADIVWVTGMMGVTYQTELTAAVAELGGAASGYYFTTLPQGTSGGEGHPNVAQHAAAADALEAFLLENCLLASHKADFVTRDELSAAIQNAKDVSNPSAALQDAITMAQMELDVNTTDEYRLGTRATALKNALNGYVTGIDLMPIEGVTQTPTTGDDDYVWPYYGTDRVTLYKAGDGNYWPYVHTEYNTVVDLDITPYLTLDVWADCEWNLHIAYIDKDGNRQTVTATDAANTGVVNFAATERKVTTVDFGGYVKSLGHANDEGRVTVVGCDFYVVGNTDQFVSIYTAALTDNDGVSLPDTITGPYTIENEVLSGTPADMTVEELVAAMDNNEYLYIVEANGDATTGVLKTGMRLQMIINGTVVDEAVIAVAGDLNGDGAVNTVDARELLGALLADLEGLSAAQRIAADCDNNDAVNTNDVRSILQTML